MKNPPQFCRGLHGTLLMSVTVCVSGGTGSSLTDLCLSCGCPHSPWAFGCEYRSCPTDRSTGSTRVLAWRTVADSLRQTGGRPILPSGACVVSPEQYSDPSFGPHALKAITMPLVLSLPWHTACEISRTRPTSETDTMDTIRTPTASRKPKSTDQTTSLIEGARQTLDHMDHSLSLAEVKDALVRELTQNRAGGNERVRAPR
jgi:hypothetical protein